MKVTGELLNPEAQQRLEEQELPPLIQVMPELDVELPHAPSGRPPFRKIEGSLFLPEPVAVDVQRQAEGNGCKGNRPSNINEMRKNILPTHRKNRNIFRLLGGGGGVPSPFIFRDVEQSDNEQTKGEPVVPVGDQGDPTESTGQEESNDEVTQQPIPSQM